MYILSYNEVTAINKHILFIFFLYPYSISAMFCFYIFSSFCFCSEKFPSPPRSQSLWAPHGSWEFFSRYGVGVLIQLLATFHPLLRFLWRDDFSRFLERSQNIETFEDWKIWRCAYEIYDTYLYMSCMSLYLILLIQILNILKINVYMDIT